MTSTFAQDLIASMIEAAAHARGEVTGSREHIIAVPDVSAMREALSLSQQAFASAYCIPLATLEGWEQGRHHPVPPPALICGSSP